MKDIEIEFTEEQANPEDLYKLTIHLKSGRSMYLVNQLGEFVELVPQLMGDSEYDGGDGTVEIRGVRIKPIPSSGMICVKPWSVAAIELNEFSIKEIDLNAVKGLS